MKNVRMISISLLLFGILFAGVAIAEETVYTIETNTGKLTAGKTEEGAALITLTPKTDSPDRPFSWIEEGPPVPIWTITVLDADKKKQTVTALSGTANVYKISEHQILLEWPKVQPGNLKVQCTITVLHDDLVWNLSCETREPDYTLWDIVYPEIGPLAFPETAHAITTNGWGVLQKNIRNWRYSATYPSASRAMPFIGVSDGKTGVYAGVHDRNGHPFDLFIGGRPNEKSISMGIRHDVEEAGKATHYRLPYSITTTLFLGDWYECAQIYRHAAKRLPWGNIPPLSDRRDIPQWLLDTDLWYCGACENEETADRLLAFARYFDVPTSAHIYTWHEIPFDDHYPEYFPAKPGFKNAVEKVQQAGVAVMPYINGRLWDPATDSWQEQKAETACAIDENGEKYVEIYGSKVPLSPMCPSTEIWKNTVTKLVDRLLNEYGVKAVYIDQISAAAAKRCYATNHGHPIGGGTYWIQGYRDLIERCRRVQPAGTALTTEENADPWNDQLQAWLLVNTPQALGEIVPIYPAVYSGRTISFGFQYIHGNDLPAKYPFRLKMARAFVFGSQLGWVGSQVLDASNAQEAEYLKGLCKARHGSRDALQYGELLPPIAIEGCGTVSWTEEGKEQIQPAVLASAWLTPDSIHKISITNVADDSRTVILNLDRRHIGDRQEETILLQTEDKSSSTEFKKENNIWRGSIVLPPRSAAVYRLVAK